MNRGTDGFYFSLGSRGDEGAFELRLDLLRTEGLINLLTGREDAALLFF